VTGHVLGEPVYRQVTVANIDQPPAARQITGQLGGQRVGQFALGGPTQVEAQRAQHGKGEAGGVVGGAQITAAHNVIIVVVDGYGLVAHEDCLPGLTCIDLWLYFYVRSGYHRL